MPLPRSPNRRAALRTLAAFPLITAARGALRPHARTHQAPAHHTPDGFRNPSLDFSEPHGWRFRLWIAKRVLHMFSKTEPVNIPRIPGESAPFHADVHLDTVTWIGHTTVLVHMDGKNILTDPVWTHRAGPAKMIGAPRISDPGLRIEDLPAIDIVLISHNHYDHLDEDAVRRIAQANPLATFLVPLGVGSWLRARDVLNVRELDWWENIRMYGLTLTCTPAQHFSGRGLGDHNKSLWATWSVEGKAKRLFFGGDSGYAPLFKEIGRRLGPFDLSLLPIGAYDPRTFMRPVHMDPAEAVQASLDLHARTMLATHWGTFLLTDERADDPPRKMEEAVRSRSLPHEHYWTFMLGETRSW
jgi:N-acyl-phosphatidylethanolamine-hydrolysing phospholipase D